MPGFVRDSSIRNITSAGSPVSTIAASFTSDPLVVGTFVEAIAFINVTGSVTGTSPTLDCKIQYSPDYSPTNGGGTWVDSGDAFTQITATTAALYFKKLSSNFGKYIRFVFTVGGTTPSFPANPYVALKA